MFLFFVLFLWNETCIPDDTRSGEDHSHFFGLSHSQRRNTGSVYQNRESVNSQVLDVIGVFKSIDAFPDIKLN